MQSHFIVSPLVIRTPLALVVYCAQIVLSTAIVQLQIR